MHWIPVSAGMAELNELTDAPLAESEGDADETLMDENTSESEWADFHSTAPAESTFGSSGYSSLAGTSDNLQRNTLKMESHFGESGALNSHGGSLEDLVESFDEKITACFGDLDSDVSDFAPVAIRTHEELLSQNKFWKDLTASFGTVLPVDWSQTVIRNKLFLPVLALNPPSSSQQPDPQQNGMATADEVIKEIDAMMQQGDDGEPQLAEQTGSGDAEGSHNSHHPALPLLPSPLYDENLQNLNPGELQELQSELEKLTQQYSEILVQELALRDELQFEKEVKNSFISELIKVQNKRRQFSLEKKRGSQKAARTPDKETKILTTVIPYEPGQLTTRHLQVISKILKAMNEDSPTTTPLLTDYILKVLCPKDTNVPLPIMH
ncbi:hypothetical protein RvY_16831-2 [Ramazzottius varieornatus]|uniref:Fasciculation and elongation protein zeta-2 n=1 Tax=Ramazzottius varieornatus TaxID=947166 RepID=A0A1D1VZW1_RAMVA|nr:hypothetical protein RvY_16831-2 [Ramazzottius varieornatus]